MKFLPTSDKLRINNVLAAEATGTVYFGMIPKGKRPC